MPIHSETYLHDRVRLGTDIEVTIIAGDRPYRPGDGMPARFFIDSGAGALSISFDAGSPEQLERFGNLVLEAAAVRRRQLAAAAPTPAVTTGAL